MRSRTFLWLAILTGVVFGNQVLAATDKQSAAQSAMRAWPNEEVFKRLPADTYQPPASNGLLLVKDGKPLATIVVAGRTNAHIDKAASELQSHLKLITGAVVPIVTVNEKWSEPVILVGKSGATDKYGVQTDDLVDDSFRVQSGPGFVALAGGEEGLEISTSGTRLAVCDFLERECGVRWLVPDKLGTHFTLTTTLGVPLGLNRRKKADMLWRVMQGNHDWRERQGHGGIKTFLAGGHTWGTLVPLTNYWQTHPEYYALFQGKRSAKSDKGKNAALCVSNPDVLKIAVKSVEDVLDNGCRVFALAQPDSYGNAVPHCQCANCLKIGDARAQAEWFHKKIAEAIVQSRPDKYVTHLAYGPTTSPGPGLTFGKNVIVDLATGKIEDWKAVPCAGFSAYVYNFTSFNVMGFPNGPKNSLANTVCTMQGFKQNRIKGVYWCGFANCWPLEGLNYYVAAKMERDLAADPRALTDEWLKLMYGPAEPAMRKFWLALSRMAQKQKELTAAESRGTAQQWVAIVQPALVAELFGHLDEAVKLAGQDRTYLTRIVTARDMLRFVQATANVFRAFLDYQEAQADMNRLRALAQALRERQQVFDEIVAEHEKGEEGRYAGLRFAGPFATKGVGDRKYLAELVDGHGPYGAIKHIRTLPVEAMLKYFETQKPSQASAARVSTPPTMDGRINPGEYGNAKPFRLINDNSGNAIDESLATEVRVAFDHKNLYMGFVCHEPLINDLKGLKEERERKIWDTDCIEVFVQPNPEQDRNMHFMVSAGNYVYDARYGYITDELDPMAYNEDMSWTTAWQHAACVDKDGKVWSAEVALPFESLGVEAPSKGALWRVQFSRERYPEKFLLMAFSPTFGNFHNQARFGTLIFE